MTDYEELAQEDSVDQFHVDKDELEARAMYNLTIPKRACLNEVRRFQGHHLYIGRGSRQRGIPPSQWGNPFSVAKYGRYEAIDRYQRYLESDSTLKKKVKELGGRTLVCHCKPNEHCHSDVLITYFKQHIMPFAQEVSPPTSALLSLAADNRRTLKEEDSDTEADVDAAPRGAGWIGTGDPLQVGQGLKRRGIVDGAGLCSPGRWPKSQRRFPQSNLLTELRRLFSTLLVSGASNKAFSTLLCGRCAASPFESSKVEDLRVQVVDLLARHGHEGSRRPTDEPSPVHFRLLSALLQACGDPDWKVFNTYATGVRVGVGVKMPRTPPVYAPERSWKLPLQRDREAHDRDLHDYSVFQKNYRSAVELQAAVEKELRASVASNMALEMSEAEARERFGNKLVVASLGAIVKDGEGENLRIRLLYDGSHGVPVNDNIRVRDRDQMPAAPDIKRVLRQVHAEGGVPVGVKLDIKGAHRLIPIAPCDWHLLGCRSHEGRSIFINRTGTFGVASAACWWGRLAGAVMRLLHYLCAHHHALYVLLVADDAIAISTDAHFRLSLMYVFLLMDVLAIPISWSKVSGGTLLNWVGYELLLREYSLGVSASRATWLRSWMRKLISDKSVRICDFVERLGRASYVYGALEFDKPFLAPLYSFASHYSMSSVRPLPLYVMVTLKHLADRLELRRHYCCSATQASWESAWRVDAQASKDGVGVGGWWPYVDEHGNIVAEKSRWFSCHLEEKSVPWAFQKGINEAYRFIASLEALAVLAALVLFAPYLSDSPSRPTLLIPAWTDNQSNGFSLNKLLTTKFPLCAVIMELAVRMEEAKARVDVHWTPRDRNAEADRLANGDCSGFDPALRLDLDWAHIKWRVLDKLIATGQAFHAQKLEDRAAGLRRQTWRKRKRGHRLRDRDPW